MFYPAFFLLLLPTRPAYLPDPVLSPGVALAGVTAADVCKPGYAGKARNVTAATKREVFRRYGVPSPLWNGYEIDHLLSLELGGSNHISNLYAQPWDCVVNGRQMGARVKDRAENAIHKAVCDGRITLAEAQRIMATDWSRAYLRFVSPEFPREK
jgi:hypothetical protein